MTPAEGGALLRNSTLRHNTARPVCCWPQTTIVSGEIPRQRTGIIKRRHCASAQIKLRSRPFQSANRPRNRPATTSAGKSVSAARASHSRIDLKLRSRPTARRSPMRNTHTDTAACNTSDNSHDITAIQGSVRYHYFDASSCDSAAA